MTDTGAFTARERAPFKVGVCMEFAGGSQVIRDFYDAIRMVCDEHHQQGALDRPVELVIREVHGPMTGTDPVVLAAWRELACQEDCLAIIGPEVTEANLAIVDEVNSVGVPTISFCATLDWAGPYAFALPNGCFPDESNLLAAYLAAKGFRSIGVFHEEGIIGDEFFGEFRAAARRYGLQIVSDHVVGLFNTQAPVYPQLMAVRAADADCVVVFSAYGALAPVRAALSKAKAELGWDPPKFQNMTWVGLTAFGATGDYDAKAMLAENEGWCGLDQIHEGNTHFQHMLDRFETRYGRRPFHCYTALGFDHGLVIADSLARMREPSPKGFKHALERLRMQPACIGAPGNHISFGSHDNRGYKGQYIVMRTVQDGREQIVDVDLGALLPTAPRRIGFENAEPQSSLVSRNARGPRTPHRIGVVQDWALWAPVKDWYAGLQLAFEEAFECGVLDRPIELVIREVEGPPDGPSAGVIKAWRELAHQENVLAIVGPHITDMAIIMRDIVEAEKVPTISHCATFNFDGEYCFLTPNGTFADETFLIASHLAKRGVKSVGVVREDNPIGDEYFNYFRQHVRRLGISVTSDQIVSPRLDRAGALNALEAIRASGAESIAHMGYGLAFFSVLEAAKQMVETQGWDVPRVTITTWVMASGLSEKRGSPVLMNLPMPAELLEGWVGVDLPHEGNPVFTGFMERYVARFGGDRPFNCYPAHFYDIGRVLAEGIARARPVTPAGLKRGLEQVRMVPAAMGGPGTVLGFAPYDHRGYKGPDYLVLRGVKDGVEGLAQTLFGVGR